MDFDTRYKTLNNAQKTAVDTLEGPVMVIAGPGTGKTELLSMRAANILRSTDTLAENILCLTFTDSGATAMRARLATIIGSDAYRVAIHTFHSFGTEIISSNREYFYHSALMKPADDLTQLEILTQIFDELKYDNPLASKMNGTYAYLGDTLKSISDLKRSGLTSDELLAILDANDTVMDACEHQLAKIFADRISKSTIDKLSPIAEMIAGLPQPKLPAGMTPLASTLALSLAHAIDTASSDGKTTAITAWKNSWLEKNTRGDFVFKSRKRQDKLRALAFVYFRYLAVMNERGRYDYDDMILEVVHAFETQPDLRYNLQEKYQYIMVDEFQDTNLAQLRLLLDIGDNPVHEGRPNILVVGDDDQAIYSFQGAEVGNILQFRARFPTLKHIVLTENYRSAPIILQRAEAVIDLSSERLTKFDETLQKNLHANVPSAGAHVALHEYDSQEQENHAVAEATAALIKQKTNPADIAILARTHRELETLVPYLAQQNILVNYERRDNVLDSESVTSLELLARIVVLLYEKRLADADALLPELLGHPAFAYDPRDVWQLSLTAYTQRRLWLDMMSTIPVFAPLHAWLIETASQVPHQPLETMLDRLIGNEQPNDAVFISPLKQYFFSDTKQQQNPETYLTFLSALTTLRAKLRDFSGESARLQTFLEFIDLHRDFDRPIMNLRDPSSELTDAVHLMTAHKSKGLEFLHVFIVGGTDKQWGMAARGRSGLIAYPENLPLAASTGSVDERLRLFFVAMTRAKKTLDISYAAHDQNGKPLLAAGFLTTPELPAQRSKPVSSLPDLIDAISFDWHATLVDMPQRTMKQLLAPQLERYRLSATHVNNFIDIPSGGPQYFLTKNLLHFPSSRSPSASYGTAIHTALQQAHMHLIAQGSLKPIEDVLQDFTIALKDQQLSEQDLIFYTDRGLTALSRFLSSPYGRFSIDAKPEYNFEPQHVMYGDAQLTGKLDVVSINPTDKTISVTDYKTGKPARDWRGRADYEKIKLHKYKQQLMFYRLLTENSRDFHASRFTGGYLQFVEPDASGEIAAPLSAEFSDEEYDAFKALVCAIWSCICALDLPDISQYSPDYAGIRNFEQDLVDRYNK